MNKLDELQAEHQHLLKEYEANRDSNELLSAVRSYIETARAEAELVTLPRDRDQLRANLRFWASFVFDKTSIYPETTLRPATLASPSDQPIRSYNQRIWPFGASKLLSSLKRWQLVVLVIMAVANLLVLGIGLYIVLKF